MYLGLDFREQPRRGDGPAGAIDATASSAARSGAKPGLVPTPLRSRCRYRHRLLTLDLASDLTVRRRWGSPT